MKYRNFFHLVLIFFFFCFPICVHYGTLYENFFSLTWLISKHILICPRRCRHRHFTYTTTSFAFILRWEPSPYHWLPVLFLALFNFFFFYIRSTKIFVDRKHEYPITLRETHTSLSSPVTRPPSSSISSSSMRFIAVSLVPSHANQLKNLSHLWK